MKLELHKVYIYIYIYKLLSINKYTAFITVAKLSL